MSQQLRDALAQAADAGRAEFAARDAAEVISPATARVRRQRAALGTAGALGVAVLVGGIAWAVGGEGIPGVQAVTPAGTAQATVQATLPPDTNPWSTLQLAAVAQPREVGEKRADSAAGMICHHSEPTDDPRVKVREAHSDVMTHAVAFTDCTPVWFKEGPLTSDSDMHATLQANDNTLSVWGTVRNDSANPLEIDHDSIFAWVETNPNTIGVATVSTYAHMVVGSSMWGTSGHTDALLSSTDDTSTIEPGASLDISAIASDGFAGEGPIANLIESGSAYSVTFWARIHEDNPSGDATYLIQLGAAHVFGGASP